MKAMENQWPEAEEQTAPKLTRRLSLRTNFSWTLAGNATYAASQWVILVLLAKLAEPQVVGQFALGMAITAPILMLTNLSLRTVQATDARGEFCFGDYFGHRQLATGIAVLAVAAIAAAGRYHLGSALVIALIGTAKAFESLSDICYGLAQAHERMDRVAISMITKALLSTVLFGVAVAFTGNPIWGAAALALSWALVYLQIDLNTVRLICRLNSDSISAALPRYDADALRRLTIMALPLGISMMLLSLSLNIPRYFLEHYRGEYDLGIFSAMAYIVVAGLTVVHALGQSASPRLSRLYASGERRAFLALLLKITGLGLLLGVAGISVAKLGGRELLTLLYKPEYAVEQESFLWLMLAAAVSYMANFLGYGICASRKFHSQLIAFITVVLATAFCSWLWVPAHGVKGAVWAFCAGNTVNLILFIFILAGISRKMRSQDIS